MPEPTLPPGLDLLWGRREPGSRGPKRGRSVDTVVAAAIAVADAEGLEAVSMARVAAEVGFTTMSLYRYVSSKDELLQLMWNASAREVADLKLTGRGWRRRLLSWSLAQRGALDRHRWITQLPITAPPLGPSSLAFVEIGLQTLEPTGLSDQTKLRVIGLLSEYTLNDARMAHDAARAAEAAGAATPGAADFEQLLRLLVDEERFPILYRIAWSTDPAVTATAEEEFRYGVERILDAVQVLIDRLG